MMAALSRPHASEVVTEHVQQPQRVGASTLPAASLWSFCLRLL